MESTSSDRYGQKIAPAWIGKALNLRAASPDLRRASATSVAGSPLATTGRAQNDDMPELLTVARTISKWEDEIVAGALTGVTHARSQAQNTKADSAGLFPGDKLALST
jgi:hypothetical protein